MRNVRVLVFMLPVILLAPGAVYADNVTAGDYVKFGDRPGSPGGEFLLTVSDTVGGSAIDQFITFCLQKTEYIDFSHTFVVGAVSTATDDLPAGDPLDERSAYLYTQFRNGTLQGYTLGNATQANLLQNAFWWFENEPNTANQSTNPYVILAQNAVNSGAWSGLGQVRVLNLFTLNGQHAQDQLVLVPLPVPEASTLLLITAGIVALGVRRRKALPFVSC